MSKYLIKTSTERFLYHVTAKNNRDSIMKNGLLANSKETIGYKNAVFAHNSPYLSLEWYPFGLDYYDWEFHYDEEWNRIVLRDAETIRLAIGTYYDIWRIDTLTMTRSWFIDTVAQKEFGGSIFKKYNLYVMSYGNISPKHLQLCQLGNDTAVRHLQNSVQVELVIPEILPIAC